MKLKISAKGLFKYKFLKLAFQVLPLLLFFAANQVTAQTVNIQAAQPNANETGPADGQFIISVSGALANSSYLIDFEIDGASTATVGDDFDPIGSQVLIGTNLIGAGSAIVDINIIDDDVVELTENVILNITSSPDLTPVTSSAEVEIANNDVGVITVVPIIQEGNEQGSSIARFGILLDKANGTGLTVVTDYTLTGSATEISDYSVTGNANFISNGTIGFKNITITPEDDAEVEGTETVTLTLNTTNNPLFTIGADNNADVSILDNDYTATISVIDAVANENGNTGRFTIDLGDVNNTGNTITVNYNITGSADNTDDYNTIDGSVQIADGNQTATVIITPKDDNFFEGSEEVILTLTDGTGYELGTGDTAKVTISDNDVVGVNVNSTTGTTTEAGGTATFIYTLTSEPTADVILRIDQYDNSEISGPTNITITPANWDTGVPLTITGENDTMVDGDTVNPIRVRIENSADPNYDSLGDNEVPVVVVTNLDDDEFVVSMSANDPNATENTPSDDSGIFLITLDQINNTGSTLVVNFSISGTASTGDYSNLGTSALIPNDSQDVNVVVTPIDDTIVENSETVVLTLASGAGYSIDTSNDSGIVTIEDNDFIATVTASDDEAAESTPANATGEFIIDLGAPNNTGSSITVNYTMSGAAVEGTDYTNLAGSVTILNGQRTETVTIVPIDDAIMEGAEIARITLTNGANYILDGIASSTATVTIDDNDTATISIADETVNEDDATGVMNFEVELDIAVDGGFQVPFTISNGTATGGGVDFIIDTASPIIFSGNVNEIGIITVNLIDDLELEQTEEFSIRLGIPTNGVQLADGEAIGVINDDDNCVAAPLLDESISNIYCVEDESSIVSVNLFDFTNTPAPDGTELIWSRVSNPLNLNSHFTKAEAEDISTPGSYYGFFYDAANNCASGTIEVQIVKNVSPILTETDVTDAERCGSGTVLLSASPSSGASINWYETIDADTPVATGSNFTTPVLNATRSYYAEAIENGCTSQRQEVIATVGIQETTGTATNGSICNVAINGPTVLDLDDRLQGEGTGAWVVKTDPSNSIVLNDENRIDFTGLISGDYVFTFTTLGSTAPCSEESVDVTISVSDCETDEDNDGLFGGEEATLGTEPNNPDTDGDGIEDGEEVGPDIANPLDEDGDGIIDALDSNTDDTDSDGVNDQQDPANENPCIPDNSSPDCPVDLEVTKSASITDAVAGDEIVFTVIVTNLADKLVDEVIIGDFIESGFQYVSHTTSMGLYDEVTGQWVIEDLAALAAASLEITVLVQEEGAYTNTAELLSSTPLDDNPANDTATVTIETEVLEGIDLLIVKTVDTENPLVGDQITFTIQVTNLSEFEDVINNIIVKDSITSGAENLFNYTSHSPSNADYDELTSIWTIPSLAFGEANMVTLKITGTVTSEGSFDNTAFIRSSSPKDNTDESNNQSTVTVNVDVPTPADPGFLFNQFSPNGDGTNDVLTINLRNTETGLDETIIYKINIFDRYGNLVFASDQEQTGREVWDGTFKGKEVPKGTYFYILNYSINSSEPTIDKGWIQLIR